MHTFDMKEAINAISDVVQNRPRPLRIFDQIYMKTGDMVHQSELIARWSDGKKIAFIGDGDSISVCVAYLKQRGVIDYGPIKITVFDFDERICNAIKRFADKERLDWLDAELYNCADPFPASIEKFDCFYTNPPWGQRNSGESVKVFTQRGIEAVKYKGDGAVVIAHDNELEWTKMVLSETQSHSLSNGFFINEMTPGLHSYHLDDAPDLKSCNIFLKALPSNIEHRDSVGLSSSQLENFYGKDNNLRVRYIEEKTCLDYGKAHENEYELKFY